MIAHKEMDLDPCISALRQFSQQSYITLWYYLSVFIPEIKNITYDKNFSSIILYFFQEFDDNLFPFKASFMIRSTKMKIRKEINFFIRGKLHVGYFFC